mmetsp:Transcript_10250/g.17628  ORF Transcript_10250/g.17628 Transcript_10250/m.17628 type:complete len:246 (+) Transcript_10250:1504-2241(+)
MLLKAADHTRLAVGDILAEQLHLGLARLLHGVLEVNVFREADLLVEQSCAALVRELVAVVLQASQHACGSRRDPRAQRLAILVARISERAIHTDVLCGASRQLEHDSFAARRAQLVLVILKALDDAAIVTRDRVERILLVTAHLFDVIAALITHVGIQAEVGCTADHHLLELHLAFGGEVRLLAVLLKAHLGTSHTRLNVCAELLLVLAAETEKDSVEAHVVRILNLLAEKLLLAVPRQLCTLLA